MKSYKEIAAGLRKKLDDEIKEQANNRDLSNPNNVSNNNVTQERLVTDSPTAKGGRFY